jgi:hypothetical protein
MRWKRSTTRPKASMSPCWARRTSVARSSIRAFRCHYQPFCMKVPLCWPEVPRE